MMHAAAGIRKLTLKWIFGIAVLLLPGAMQAQTGYRRYNTDSLLKRLSANREVRSILDSASRIYKAAGITPSDISPQAFKIAFLEKSFLESGRLNTVVRDDSNRVPGHNRSLLTVVDFTRRGNRKRWVTVDLARKKIRHHTLVSHGAAAGKGKEILLQQGWPAGSINAREAVPLFFGNEDSSGRSSLGLVLSAGGDNPDNLCHLCREFISRPHKCVVLLEGLEAGINDHMQAREIVVHTTGSADFSDSLSATIIAERLPLTALNKTGLLKEACGCREDTASAVVGSYASACGIASNKGYIGRSSGCLVLPEKDHRLITETIQESTLIFLYSDRIAPTSTDYFADSPIMARIVQYVEGATP